MIDLHCHLIYDTDDGANKIGDSIKIIKEAADAGFKKLCCTPHYLSPQYVKTKQENNENGYINEMRNYNPENYEYNKLEEKLKKGEIPMSVKKKICKLTRGLLKVYFNLGRMGIKILNKCER